MAESAGTLAPFATMYARSAIVVPTMNAVPPAVVINANGSMVIAFESAAPTAGQSRLNGEEDSPSLPQLRSGQGSDASVVTNVV